MSATRKQTGARLRAKALDLWQPPAGSGEPLICLATTFTFDATFFETECLGRFLEMSTHPQEDEAVSYLIEREEKLAAARVCVMVDRRHAQMKESLRWDILPVIAPGACMHAKIAALCWSNFVRVITGSGNLTEPGYRKNLEVFTTLEASPSEGGAVDEILRYVDFLEEVAARSLGDDGRSGPRRRAREALAALRRHIQHWPRTLARRPGVIPVFSGTGRPVFEQLRNALPGGPPRYVEVVSPFFDRDDRSGATVTALVDVMAKRRPRVITFSIPFEESPDGRTRLFAPRAVVASARHLCDVEVYKVSRLQDGEPRSMHAKMLVMANDDWELWMIGSSNFTGAGCGLSNSAANLEANLAYLVRSGDAGSRALSNLFPEASRLDIDITSDKILWEPAFDREGESGADAIVALPAAFREALFDAGSAPRLILLLDGNLPVRWRITISGGEEIFNSQMWGGRPGEVAIDWQDKPAPLVLGVEWETSSGAHSADWPVNVVEPASLPAPDALRNLSLEELIDILGTARPLHEAVARALRRRAQRKTGDLQLDPHKRVDTHEFLLRRTKRVAVALERLRERLERPAFSADAFDWRLKGPVGPMRLAEAFRKEARTMDEARFFLAELGLALSRVRVERAAEGGLSPAKLRECVRASIEEIEMMAASPGEGNGSAIGRYVAKAFEEAKR